MDSASSRTAAAGALCRTSRSRTCASGTHRIHWSSRPCTQPLPETSCQSFATSRCAMFIYSRPALSSFPEALQGWLIRVTTNKCYHWKHRQINRESDLDEDVIQNLSALDAVPPDVLAEVETEQMVREAIACLPPRCRQMIELLFFEHPPTPYQEVARRLNLATGSIGFIRGRCLKRLKKLLQEKGF